MRNYNKDNLKDVRAEPEVSTTHAAPGPELPEQSIMFASTSGRYIGEDNEPLVANVMFHHSLRDSSDVGSLYTFHTMHLENKHGEGLIPTRTRRRGRVVLGPI